MIYALIIVVIVIGLVLAGLYLPDKTYADGYNAALETIENGYSPQEMYKQCLREGNGDSWDKGWMNACVDKGAKR